MFKNLFEKMVRVISRLVIDVSPAMAESIVREWAKKHGITVTRRPDDWHACAKGKPAIWGCGRNVSEAISDLLRSHPEHFAQLALEVK